MKKKISILIVFVFAIAFLFRFYNILWGSPYFFHPDERNIAYATERIRFPNQLNPQFFAYGSFPIYVIYFTGVCFNFFSHFLNIEKNISDIFSVSFENAIFFGRFYSAVFSFISIFLTVKIYKKISNKTPGTILLMWLLTTSAGFIQFAHFATFEMWLTFFTLLQFYYLLKFFEQKKVVYFSISSVIFGLLLSIKISSLTLFPISLFIIKKTKLNWKKNLVIFLVTAFVTGILTSPFYVLDFSTFKSNITYESNVATETLPVFYSGQFFYTIPILFQLTKVYPFLINPMLTILFIPSLLYVTIIGFKKTKNSYLLLLFTYLLLFLPQSFLFVKWTRYMVPTLPFIYLIITIFLSELLQGLQKKVHYYYISIIVIITITISIGFAFSYFLTVYLNPDTRIQASSWASEHIPKNAKILSEVYDLGIIPFNQYFQNIQLFNFYYLDNTDTSDGGRLSLRSHDSSEVNDLEQKLRDSDYLILPSQRILKNRITNKQKFPVGFKFYYKLLSGKLGYKKIYETPCDIFCKIIYMGDPVFNIEETANVFDRPMVFIFKHEKL
ncbi:MAG: hypothetical protein A3F31_01130 [Candidatus Levybacteria bacterium RIFCSPHIGHO2_12_FULL_38_12]|nr:MAG: hypothetical protein A2770_01800 [Candidatus Levybacteria bacterium RIFCSPHIGHO2_01_FULL_38_12]OGH23252.1 MAG: hypothetical protein A3F31_01130 [Candidatus Levybacteria bacterium RIFCSPHIGHO2_12_FULL_38_12]OGH33723.1 MAG: hypothetical protein A3A47_02765 [Candidatus Levybacteria bacterium RIFCSPLOWO2_01_FULL_37_20]OGH44629.1 MAG: hypothetical protein A3J14_00850 [Candidatus Levybacteria bacterium RIFCSPLOWO2_02_FULL_37_18]